MTHDAAVHLDVDLRLTVRDRERRFDLDVQFSSHATAVALYGPSGAGKSLTLQALAGLIQPRSGHIRLGHKTLFDAAAGVHLPPQRRGMGYLFQDYALFPHLTVRQNIEFGLTSWARRRLPASEAARIQSLIESLELHELVDARPAALSGGQQQRVALARALACEPELLLLDEPFAALNPMLRARLRRDLAALRAQWQIPIVMISHDIEDVLALADLAYVIDGGRVVREIDIRHARSREMARQALTGEAEGPGPQAGPHDELVRHLLLTSIPHF